jgi:diaminopimelate decarboxylase
MESPKPQDALDMPETLKISKKCKGRVDLIDKFIRALDGRQKILSKQTLHRYLISILQNREILLQGFSRYGSPQYFFDEPALARNVAQFQSIFSGHFKRFRAFYAMKSNPFSGLCKHVVDAGMGLDVSSGFELAKALAFSCNDVIFSGPAKTDAELKLALANLDRVVVLLDSGHELERLSRLKRGVAKPKGDIRVGVRVRGNNHGPWDKFGVPLKELPSIFLRASSMKGIKPAGIQFHTSWNLNPSAQVGMIEEIGAFIRSSSGRCLRDGLRFLDIGGGYWPEGGEWLNPQNTLKGSLIRLIDRKYRFPSVHYHRKSTPLESFAHHISRALSLQGPPLSQLEIWTEPGRWICHSAMHILLSVVDKKSAKVAITDGGTNLLGWERPLTEFIPIMNLSRPSLRKMPCVIFGSLCTPNDVWGTSIFGDGIGPGDVLVVPDQGAYTYSLRQSFIKPKARVVQYNGKSLEEVEKEEAFLSVS